MNTLYKYYSDGFDVIDHLLNPAIKLATTESLNDPFEKQLSNDLAGKLAKNYSEKEQTPLARSSYKKTYKEISSQFGVVSLTETHRNILMWAYYANSHKGVCIGYKSNLFDDLSRIKHNNLHWKGIYFPERVIYDSQRFDPEKYNPELSDDELIMQEMKKKSNDWIHEKEHRCIIPLFFSDELLIIEKDNCEKNKKAKEMLSLSEQRGHITRIEKDENNHYSDNKKISRYKNLIEAHDSENKTIECLSKHNEINFLKRIDITSIDSIFIGSQCEQNTIDRIKEVIESDKKRYGHISVYHYHAHPNEYKLCFTPVANPKVLTDIGELLVEHELDGFEYININSNKNVQKQ